MEIACWTWRVGRLAAERAAGAAARGRLAERLAERALRKVGLRILARNWRNPRDAREELDLVAEQGGRLVFVEVRSRDEALCTDPIDTIDRRKRRAVARAARAYRRGLEGREVAWRFDVVEVVWRRDGTADVRHRPETGLFREGGPLRRCG